MAQKKQKIAELEDEAAQGDFWNDREKATLKMRELENLKKIVDGIDSLEKRIEELIELSAIVESSREKKEIEEQKEVLRDKIEDLEFKTLLSGEHDGKNVIMSLHAGAAFIGG